MLRTAFLVLAESVIARAHTDARKEKGRKVMLIRNVQTLGDLPYCHFSVLQQQLCGGDLQCEQILVGRYTILLFEKPNDIGF